jgi:hypothetical protein
MEHDRRFSIPRLLIAAASRILPACGADADRHGDPQHGQPERADWRREWNAEIWHAEHAGASQRTLLIRALGAFRDAWFVLRYGHGIGIRLHELKSSRSASVALLVVLAAILGVTSRGLEGTRALLWSADSDRVFLLAQPGPFMGSGARVPPPQAAAWMENGRTADILGRWSVRTGSICVADEVAIALFAETHMKPNCAGIRREPATITGFSGIIGRLKAGSSYADAEKELGATAELGRGWLRPAIVPVVRLRKGPLLPVGATLLLLAVIAGFGLRHRSPEAWAWGLSRIGLCFGIIAGVWLELAARTPFTEAGSIPGVWTLGLYLFPLITAAMAALWLRRDMQRRCRTCYRLLAMPVFVGFTGRCLFDSGGVEYLCTAHHGALLDGSVPGQIATKEWSQWPSSCA